MFAARQSPVFLVEMPVLPASGLLCLSRSRSFYNDDLNSFGRPVIARNILHHAGGADGRQRINDVLDGIFRGGPAFQYHRFDIRMADGSQIDGIKFLNSSRTESGRISPVF